MDPDKTEPVRWIKPSFNRLIQALEANAFISWFGQNVGYPLGIVLIAGEMKTGRAVFFKGQHQLNESLIAVFLRNRVRTPNIPGTEPLDIQVVMGMMIAAAVEAKT